MARKRKPSMPKIAGHIEPRVVEVDNPQWRPDLDGEKAFPRRVSATINVRESAVETLYARGHLDKIQKMAADRFRRLWEERFGAGIQAMDMSRDMVSGSGVKAPVTDRQIAARRELVECGNLLGKRNFQLVAQICGVGLALDDICKTGREKTTAADILRYSLDDLGERWKLGRQRR